MAGLKLLGIILYYGPFLFYLTHYFPTNEDSCLVETGSSKWWDFWTLVDEGVVTFRCERKVGIVPSRANRLLEDEELEADE